MVATNKSRLQNFSCLFIPNGGRCSFGISNARTGRCQLDGAVTIQDPYSTSQSCNHATNGMNQWIKEWSKIKESKIRTQIGDKKMNYNKQQKSFQTTKKKIPSSSYINSQLTPYGFSFFARHVGDVVHKPNPRDNEWVAGSRAADLHNPKFIHSFTIAYHNNSPVLVD